MAGKVPHAVSYSVDLCDNWTRLGEASAFELRAIIRNNAPGEWILDAPLDGLDISAANLALVDSILVRDESKTGAPITFAGIIRRTPEIPSGVVRDIDQRGTRMKFHGVDLFGLLNIRRAWPKPSVAPPWPDGYDTETGVGSTVAATYISDNFGSNARTSRQVANVTVVDPVVGTSGTWDARLQPLASLVGRVCREAGIGCIASMPSAGQIEYSFRSPVDYSTKHIFTDQGDLERLSRFVTPAAATYVIAAGQGELAARAFRTANSGSTGVDRVETVYENTNVTTGGGLQRAADTELALGGENVAIDGLIAANAAQRIELGVDYQVGDWLGIEIAGVRHQAQVEAVSIHLDADRQLVSPILGRATDDETQRLREQISGIVSLFTSQIG